MKLHFEGTFSVNTQRRKVFDLLVDPKQFSGCLPDLQRLTVKSPDEFTAVVRAGVSFIKGDFNMNFKVVERRAPSHAKLIAHGSGIGSVVDLETRIDLVESDDGGTVMRCNAEAQVGGRIASFGERLLGGEAEKVIKQLFECLRMKLESR